jgi:hypothetical protein
MPNQPPDLDHILQHLKQSTLGLTPRSLLNELEDVFPEQSPEFGESYNDLRWRGGQRSVVRWIKDRIETDQVNG